MLWLWWYWIQRNQRCKKCIRFINWWRVLYKPTKTNDAFDSNYIEYEKKEDRNKILSIIEHLNMIRPYLRGIINDHKTQGEWKIQLTMVISFISSNKDTGEICIMWRKSHNTEIMISNETHKIIEERFAFPLQKYQEEVEEKIRGSEAFLYSADLLHYHLHKISLNRRGSYKDSTG